MASSSTSSIVPSTTGQLALVSPTESLPFTTSFIVSVEASPSKTVTFYAVSTQTSSRHGTTTLTTTEQQTSSYMIMPNMTSKTVLFDSSYDSVRFPSQSVDISSNSEFLEELSLRDVTDQVTYSAYHTQDGTFDVEADSKTMDSMEVTTGSQETTTRVRNPYGTDTFQRLRTYIIRNVALVSMTLSSFALLLFSVIVRIFVGRLLLRKRERRGKRF
jgi:hypothetical protein